MSLAVTPVAEPISPLAVIRRHRPQPRPHRPPTLLRVFRGGVTPAVAELPTQKGPKASCSISTTAAAWCCPKQSIPGACGSAISTPETSYSRPSSRPGGSTAPSAITSVPARSLATGRERVRARLFRGRPRCAGALSGRYAWRPARLVSIRSQIQRTPRLPVDLHDERQDERAVRDATRMSPSLPNRRLSRSAFTRPTLSRSSTGQQDFDS